MRRLLAATGLAGLSGLALFAALRPGSAIAEPGQPEQPALAAKAAPALPVSGCVLFSSGVGYFQREGAVEGDARVDLTFPVQDINDLLKSMVLQDFHGGRIAAVSYDSHDPIDKTLKSFAVNLTNNPSYGDLLNQARGEKVEVVSQATGGQPGTLTGTVVGVEHQKQAVGKETVDVELLNLWCAEGMRSVKLPEVQRVRFLNPVMESEVRRALEVLALSHDTQKKAVSLSFSGEGKRSVRVGYVIENPVWKTSYRLVLGKEGKAYLQGWAVVENPSDDDWKDVKMALVSGRPISFQMDLYQPLYVPRPTVVPELFASLMPRTYEGRMDQRELKEADKAAADDSAGKRMRRNKDGKAGALGEKGDDPTLFFGAAGRSGGEGRRLEAGDMDRLALQQGVQSAANAAQLGDYFQYSIKHPVNLPRQKSALLPILGGDVEGTRVSIYNQATHAKFPLLGLKFKNTSGQNLMQGPLTVFDNDVYAGDARILDLQPNEERLLSYAVDLGTEVEVVPHDNNGRITKVKLHKGLLSSTTKVHEARTYKAKNRSQTERLLVVEHPFRPDFTLVSKEKPSERARDVYRFEVKVPAGKNGEMDVAEERDVVSTIQLSNSDDPTMRYFLSQTASSDKVKEALKGAIQRRDKLSATQQDLARTNADLKQITDDQTRLRANLKEMPPTAAAYKRYLEKFDKQEGEIEALQAKVKTLQDQELADRRAFDEFLAALDVE